FTGQVVKQHAFLERGEFELIQNHVCKPFLEAPIQRQAPDRKNGSIQVTGQIVLSSKFSRVWLFLFSKGSIAENRISQRRNLAYSTGRKTDDPRPRTLSD